jgi:hypothetical protein
LPKYAKIKSTHFKSANQRVSEFPGSQQPPVIPSERHCDGLGKVSRLTPKIRRLAAFTKDKQRRESRNLV